MPIKVYKPNRAARKNSSIVDRRELYRGEPHKPLLMPQKRGSGRGSAGKITVRHRGGGEKQQLRIIDFGQGKLNVPGVVERVEYDPNRTGYLALVKYVDGSRHYVLAWQGAKDGDKVLVAPQTPELPGHRMQLKNITPGLSVYNVELQPGRGGQLFRSAGTSAILMDVAGTHAQLKAPSGEIRLVSKESYATVGAASNPDWWLTRIGSAGRSRHMGRRPAVRGKAMNPVDHPHGGGEGNQPIGMPHPKTPWGKPALGVKTRRRGKYSDALILQRRPSRRKKK